MWLLPFPCCQGHLRNVPTKRASPAHDPGVYASEYERLVEQGRMVRLKRQAGRSERERPAGLAHRDSDLPSFTPIFDGPQGHWQSH